jgi:hypothetical protein
MVALLPIGPAAIVDSQRLGGAVIVQPDLAAASSP